MPANFRLSLFVALSLIIAACAPDHSANSLNAKIVATLPAPVANNAVAAAPHDGGVTLYSFNGLGPGKTWRDVGHAAFACDLPEGDCRQIAEVPVKEGRLASVAVFLHDRIFLFGGYTVSEDGGEISTPEVFAFNPDTEEYQRRADMPTPVDDAVAFTHANRYIYLVSGWHNDGNVNLVQVFDTWEDRWFRATDYPGSPVFGHAGGAANGRIVIADGVAVIGEKDGKRQFGAVDEAWLGVIDPDDPAKIDWKKLPAHAPISGATGALYRMAATGDAERGQIVFYGGGDNPYNYNGIGYDGNPSTPSDMMFAFDLESGQWVSLGATGLATMDHRGLLKAGNAFYLMGGIKKGLAVSADIIEISVTERR